MQNVVRQEVRKFEYKLVNGGPAVINQVESCLRSHVRTASEKGSWAVNENGGSEVLFCNLYDRCYRCDVYFTLVSSLFHFRSVCVCVCVCVWVLVWRLQISCKFQALCNFF